MRINLGRLSAAVFAFLVPVALSLGQLDATPIDKAAKDLVLDKMGRIVLNSAFVPGKDFSTWPQFLEKNKEKIDKAATESEFAEAINADLQTYFGISHIVLITPKAAKARVERKVVGVGIQIQQEKDGLRVVGVFPGTPAAKAGLVEGDLVMEADGKKIDQVNQMMGEEGSSVKVKVRKFDGKETELTMVRQKYSNVRADKLTFVNPDTALLKVHTFDLAYSAKTIDELMGQASKSTNLILDLRSNGGGVVANMLHLLSYFLPADTEFGTFVTRRMVNQYLKETNGKPTDLRAIAEWSSGQGLKPARAAGEKYKGNVAVLINGGTGSASEITAGALKEFLGAPIVGTKSAGAVLVSVMVPLDNGWLLQYPMMDYITSQGVRLEGSGVEPDLEAASPRFGEVDTAIEKAQALLKRAELRQERGGAKPPPKSGGLPLAA